MVDTQMVSWVVSMSHEQYHGHLSRCDKRFGGVEAVDTPYARTPFWLLLRQRGLWLSVLFVGEMFTATAMGYFEHDLASAVVLAMFIPLVISSGGNTGSQAATLVVRALALGELPGGSWRRVFVREIGTGLVLGTFLGALGFTRVVVWQQLGWFDFGDHAVRLGVVVWISLIGIVCVGTIAGSMLPFALRAFRLDPATSSAPFVATLDEQRGLLTYTLPADRPKAPFSTGSPAMRCCRMWITIPTTVACRLWTAPPCRNSMNCRPWRSASRRPWTPPTTVSIRWASPRGRSPSTWIRIGTTRKARSFQA
jgi:cation transporter-like permease